MFNNNNPRFKFKEIFCFLLNNTIFNNLIELPTNYKLPVAKNITFITQWLIEDATLGIFTLQH